MNVKGHSLWLIPKQYPSKLYQKIINNLCDKYNTPVFEPHITLFGELPDQKEEIIQKVKMIAQNISPYEITVQGTPDHRDTYYQCLFLHVRKSDNLMNMRNQTEDIFNSNKKTYMPHLSLMYGIFDEKDKLKIIEEMEKINEMSFTIDSIRIMSTEGTSEEWFEVAEIPLQKAH